MHLTNLTFNKLVPSDFPLYYLLVGNEQVMAMITERALSLNEAQKEFDNHLKNNNLHPDFGFYKISDQSNGNFIGMIKLEVLDSLSEIELGYMLLPQYWRLGIGKHATQIMLKKACNSGIVKRITAIIDPDNIASKKILLTSGFISKEFRDFDGLPGEVLEYVP